MNIETPYYLIDEQRMLPAMEKIRYVRQHSGAKSVLALKCFSSWCAFDFMSQYMAGTTSSSFYEAKLGHETFKGENHGYSVAYTETEIQEVVKICDKVIFNSVNQLRNLKSHCSNTPIGLRLNPEVGFSHYALSDTVGEFSRLGATIDQLSDDVIQELTGVMFHMNCENDNFESFSKQLSSIADRFGHILQNLQWVSLGGGVAFTDTDYPLVAFSRCLADFAKQFTVQIYLEPGEAAVTESTSLFVTVLDIVDNGLPTLIIDAGVETHLLDALIYPFSPTLTGATIVEEHQVKTALDNHQHVYRIAGRTCLAGDIFGHYIFENPIGIGSQLVFDNVGGYSMVKKNFFNGISMPAICHKKHNGEINIVREFSYEDFKQALS